VAHGRLKRFIGFSFVGVAWFIVSDPIWVDIFSKTARMSHIEAREHPGRAR